MALKTTVEDMKKMLQEISHDLEKAERGNKAAAQRVRTYTIKFSKVAKDYRKESISEGRMGEKKVRKPAAKKAAKKPAVKKPIKRKR